jgi:hypothetical protein
MSLVCNKQLGLTAAVLRDKKRLAQDAGVELLGAVSDVFRALELRHHGDSVAATGVYLSSASTRLGNARELLGEVGSLLRDAILDEQTVSWYRNLDYAGLYRHGVAAGQVPASREQWAELVDVVVAGGPVAVCEAYRSRLGQLADLIAGWRRQAADEDDPTTDETLVAVQSATLSLTAYASCVAYLNKVEPLDTRWLPVTAGAASAA